MAKQNASAWVGVDLDGTLAIYDGWKGEDHIGEPIPAMVERVKQMLFQGQDVRIFTARVAVTGAYSENSQRYADQEFADHQVKIIQAWCAKHIGTVLPVTAVKDFACIAIYDDRAKQVVPNTGELVDEILQEHIRYTMR